MKDKDSENAIAMVIWYLYCTTIFVASMGERIEG